MNAKYRITEQITNNHKKIFGEYFRYMFFSNLCFVELQEEKIAINMKSNVNITKQNHIKHNAELKLKEDKASILDYEKI